VVEQLLAQINAEHPAGNDCEANPHYDMLDDMMAHYGSLHQDKINWSDVERIAADVLQQECKHFKVVLFYITSQLVLHRRSAIADSLRLVDGFWTQYRDTGYPRGGERGARRRKVLLEQTLSRIDRFSQKELVEPEEGEPAIDPLQLDDIERAFHPLSATLDEAGIDNPLRYFSASITALRSLVATPDSNKKTATAETSSSRLKDDSKNIKDGLLALSNQYCRQQPDNPLGYLLRRHLKWQSISSVPPSKKNTPKQTEMAPPNADIINEYREQILSENYSLSLLENIEKTVMNSTFWLTGSIYSAQLAYGLGFTLVGGSIVQNLKQFLARVPDLSQSLFNDGTNFLDQEAWQHIQSIALSHQNSELDVSQSTTVIDMPEASSRVEVASNQQIEWLDIQERIKTTLREQGVQEALGVINQCRAQATSLREEYYIKLFACETLEEVGLAALAGDMLESIANHAKNLGVNEWEPDYLQRAEALLDTIKSTTNEGRP